MAIFGNGDYEIEEIIRIHMIILSMNIVEIYQEVKVGKKHQ